MFSMRPKVYILILNWNGWEDTIECLESVFSMNYPNFEVIVCDNGSQNQSVERIKEWAAGSLCLQASSGGPFGRLMGPPTPKPIFFVEYSRESTESGGGQEHHQAPLVLIQNGENLGFAGGNNVGLRYAMARGDFQYVWLLNNDTVVEPNALTKMVEVMEQDEHGGICGSTLLYYDEPDVVQACGGVKYNKWLAVTRHIAHLKSAHCLPDRSAVEKQMFAVQGASMLVTKDFLDRIGLMNEAYFLYFEEIDWAIRGKDQFSLLYAPGSIVYHKEGRSIGSSSAAPKEKSTLADYYGIRNRLMITRNFFPYCLLTVYLSLMVTAFNRIRRGQLERVGMIARIALQALK